jgi:lipoprotein signal peptidase
VIPGLLNLTHVRNTGAAFGMLNSADFPYKPLVVAGWRARPGRHLRWYARHIGPPSRWARYGFVLIVAGADWAT